MSGIVAAIGVGSLTGAYVQRESSKDAIKSQEKANRAAQEFTKESVEQARNDLMKLFPYAQQRAGQGYQGALDLFGQTIPAQTQAFQGGNVAAQEAILAGLPQIQNAILGMPVDLSGLQPYQAPAVDMSMFQQQLPEQQNISSLLQGGFYENLIKGADEPTDHQQSKVVDYGPLPDAQNGTYLQDAIDSGVAPQQSSLDVANALLASGLQPHELAELDPAALAAMVPAGTVTSTPDLSSDIYSGLNISPLIPSVDISSGSGIAPSLAGLQNLNIPTIDFNALAGLRNLNIG